MNTKPATNEYAPYYDKYVSVVPEGDIVGTLEQQLAATQSLLRDLPEERGTDRYAPDKWSIKELFGHIIDTERIMSYRALRIARGDATPLPGFEQDGYITHGNFNARSLSDLAAELETVRRATLFLFKNLSDEAWLRRGVASENEITVRALAYIIAGHELHHLEILRSRYL
ncbi:MAG TPA: DinB family protein [Blastocatellia bacterium]|nr:DinB family protein [Blastocatellia bacterium]HMV86456.1 DinB family protein [Blastocatellia bacterium]HMX27922.1 DinB family protein [Blastocatellia bacterium]HMZ17108.1 DinB family protein [Blastocatellia bacterium]HNG33731.1 DinB family protein [Blastocatellia bacterium]